MFTLPYCIRTSHVKLCQTIGRGQPAFDAKKVPVPNIRDWSGRLRVFHAVAASSAKKTLLSKEMLTPPERWPLCLPAAQHALVSSNLASEPIPAEADSAPERFIAQSFMSSICAALHDPSALTNGEWYTSSSKVEGSQAVVVDDDVPLALKDARLFVLAVSRLPKEEQLHLLGKFVSEVSSAVDSLKSSASSSALIRESADVSGFLARVVTVCATLVNVVTVGSGLRDALAAEVGSSHYGMLNLVARQEITPQRRMESGEWYRSQTSFVGIFSDWESPVVPDVPGPVQLNSISEVTLSKLRSLHESAILLGFLSAEHDRCHLLFSAWNASGRSASWEMSPVTISRGETSAVDEENATRWLLDIREDICLLYREINGNEGLFPNSILTRVLSERGDGRRPGQLKRKLDSMMSKAETIVDSIFASSSSLEEAYDLPLATFALLEALSAYIAFIVATHTRSIDNILSRNLSNTSKRQDHESELGVLEHSDEDSASSGADYNEETDDYRVDALIKLKEACATFGAAPTHPDWLDVSCYFRDGVTANDAAQLAQRAMICSEKLSSNARAAHVKFLSKAMACLFEGDPNYEQRADVAINLCHFRFDVSDATRSSDVKAPDNCERWVDAVASFCGLEKWKVKMFSQNASCKNVPHVMDTFCPNAVQRIMGALQIRNNSFEDWESSLAEYRACDEWELLISEALLGSCVNIAFPEQLSAEEEIEGAPTGAKLDFRRNFVLAARWSRVQETCASHLMPVAALLRFGLSDGAGRKRHPLLNQGFIAPDGEDNTTSLSLNFCEPLPPSSSSRSSQSNLNDDVARTLGTLALIPPSNDDTDALRRHCVAVASNLMIDSNAFLQLLSMEALRSTFESIHSVNGLLGEFGDLSCSHSSSTTYIIEQLIGCVDIHGKLIFAADESSPRLKGLFSFLGGRYLSFDTISRKGVDFTDVLPASHHDNRDWKQVQDQAIAEIVGMLSCDDVDVTVETWSRVSHILNCLVRLDYGSASSPVLRNGAACLSARIVQALNKKGDSYFRTLGQWIICNPPIEQRPDEEVLERISSDLCAFVSYTVGTAYSIGRRQPGDLKGGRIVLDALLGSMDQWRALKSPVSENVLSLLCLLGARHGALHTIGSRLLSNVTARTECEGTECVEPVERFFRFLRDLENLLSESSEVNTTSSSYKTLPLSTATLTSRKSLGEDITLAADTQLTTAIPDACSFVLQSGFHQQHWYNCYTCNLVWDKGCCTLCALRCHQAQGHDVTYSRYSSFFCDCGGEAPTEEENRSPWQMSHSN